MLIDLKVKGFLDELKSDSSAPGGGSVSALAGALGAALSVMVGNLTIGNEKYAAVENDIKALQPKLEAALLKLEGYVDEDTNVFNKVMAAYKMKKGTDAEKAVRSDAIQKAMKNAAELPMLVAEVSAEVLKLTCDMLKIGNVNAASDAAVGGRLAYAAVWGAIYNVRINLNSIKDEKVKSLLKERVRRTLEITDKAMLKLAETADEKIGV